MKRYESLNYAFALDALTPGRHFRFDKGRKTLYLFVGTVDEPQTDGTYRTLVIVSRLDPRKGRAYTVLAFREYRDVPVVVY